MTSSHLQPSRQQLEKKIQCLCSQVQDSQKFIDGIQDELTDTKSRLFASCREQEDLKRAVGQKDDTIICLESKLNNVRFDMKERETSFQRQCDAIQDKACCLYDQLKQKESALAFCQKDFKNYTSQMEEIKSNFTCDLQQKETLLCQLRDKLRHTFDNLKYKSEENSKMSKEVVELQGRLAQACSDIGEASSKIVFLQEKIPLLESQFCKEKQQACEEMEELEKKLNQSVNDLSLINLECRRLKRCLQEKDEELEMVCSDKESVFRELQQEKEDSDCLRERIDTMECDNKEICRLLQIKIKTLKDMEQCLCVRDQELLVCRAKVNELSDKIRQLGTATEDGTDDTVEAKLSRCLEALTKCENERKDLERRLAFAVKEMQDLAEQVKRLTCQLEEAKSEICDKDALIQDLEQTLEHAKQDTESRMCRVDSQLQKYEKEIKDKTHLLAEVEEKCCQLHAAVANKNCEIEQLDGKLCRVHCDMETVRCQYEELQEVHQNLQSSYNNEKIRIAELCNENKLHRDQLQMSYSENNCLKRDLSNCHHESDVHVKEANGLRHCLEEKECRMQQLMEENTCLANKMAAIQCRMKDDNSQLSKKLADTKQKLECELEKMRARLCEMEEGNACLCQKLTSKDRQMVQLEKNLYQKLDSLDREKCQLQNKLSDKEYQIQATKDCIMVKDSEITRLKLRLCSTDRCNSNLNLPEQKNCPQKICCAAPIDVSGGRRAKSCDGRGAGGSWV